MFNKEKKAMIVCCQHIFCIHNNGGKCTFDEITLSQDGLCEKSVDRTNLSAVKEFLEKNKNSR